MNIRQIDIFRQVMLSKNMTAAALELGSSQPTISRTIAELEASLGFSLFERQGGRLTPTQSGEAFFREVEISFRGLDRLTQAAKEIRQIGTGRLRIAAVPSMALTLMPRAIKRFKEENPALAISLEMRSEMEISRWVAASYCDVGFTSMQPDDGGMSIEPLYSLEGVCVVLNTHPFARRKSLTPRDLRNESLIIPSSVDVARTQIDTLLRAAQLTRFPTVESPYAATICKLVEEGLGIGIVNPLAARFGASPSLSFVPLSPTIVYRGYIARLASRQSSEVLEHFVEIVRAIIHENMQASMLPAA
ncbi:MAG TPA: LysR substrate-binding domain-containing protein [Paraburkholderia sp.]|nr:LysR substrate-binding domain-containing protein [Paraburkholderia sp.]